MIGGVFAEVAAMIQENLFSGLKGPVVRIAALPIPPPAQPAARRCDDSGR
jgi:pyruvate/2-oxoglutarate/acetoin dehydrogenase E1 component